MELRPRMSTSTATIPKRSAKPPYVGEPRVTVHGSGRAAVFDRSNVLRSSTEAASDIDTEPKSWSGVDPQPASKSPHPPHVCAAEDKCVRKPQAGYRAPMSSCGNRGPSDPGPVTQPDQHRRLTPERIGIQVMIGVKASPARRVAVISQAALSGAVSDRGQ